MRCWGPACVLKGTWVFLFWWVVCTMAQWRLLWTRLHFWFLSLRFSLGHPVGAFLELSYWSPWLAAQDPSPHTHSTESAGQVPLQQATVFPSFFLQSFYSPFYSLPSTVQGPPFPVSPQQRGSQYSRGSSGNSAAIPAYSFP